MNIEIANQQQTLPVDAARLREAIGSVAAEAGFTRGDISLAVITDAEIHRLNRVHLSHDYATDVLSFVFEREDDLLEGEIIVSADTAQSTAADLNWPAEHELLLYVVHGMLHLVGYDDKQPAAREAMREAERRTLSRLGVSMPREEGVELE
jgi:probable rRNA maturation factor